MIRIKNKLTYILYLILKKDIIKKLEKKHGDQFITDVIETLGMEYTPDSRWYDDKSKQVNVE